MTKDVSVDSTKKDDSTGKKGVLVDLTKCIGCGSCVVACKMYNKNEWIDSRAPTSGENAKLADENWTVVQKHSVGTENGGEVWRFVKRQCLHCKEPACVSSCFATAFRKTELGPVVYYPNLCVGCRYCMLACPFHVPKFEWSKPIPVLTKCTLCHNRIAHGDAPACVAVCPTSVMKFGNHEELLEEAKRIVATDSRYVTDIYGEKEAGGTLWIYISDKPFKELGFKTTVPTEAIPSYTSGFMHATPKVGAIWLAILACLYFITGRRSAMKKKKQEQSQKSESRGQVKSES